MPDTSTPLPLVPADQDFSTAPTNQDLNSFQARATRRSTERQRRLHRISRWQPLKHPFQLLSLLPRRYALHGLLIILMGVSMLAGRLRLQPTPVTQSQVADLPAATSLENRPFGGVTVNEPAAIAAADLSVLVPDQRFSSRSEPLMLPTTVASEAVFQPFTTRTNAEAVNMRAGPGTVFETVTKLEQGSSVTVLAHAKNWLQIETDSKQQGWVAADLVSLPENALDSIPESATVPAPPPALVATIGTNNLNLRDGPGTNYVGLTKLNADTQVDLLARSGEWLQVQTSAGASGWVTGEFLAIQPGVLERVPETDDIPSASPELVGAVLETGVNLRSGPDTKFATLGKLAAKTELKLLARHKEWYKVETPRGTTGWIAVDFVKVSAFINRRVSVTNAIPALPTPAQPAAAQPAAAKPAAGAAQPRSSSSRWAWPASGDLTSRFGWRNLGGWRNFHDGIDIANRRGTRIMAMHSGTVTQAGWCSGYGYCVMVDHGDGFATEYGHMMAYPVVRSGQFVEAGQLIGYMGMTYDRAGGGYASGVHLHLTLTRNGSAVNPLSYLP